MGRMIHPSLVVTVGSMAPRATTMQDQFWLRAQLPVFGQDKEAQHCERPRHLHLVHGESLSYAVPAGGRGGNFVSGISFRTHLSLKPELGTWSISWRSTQGELTYLGFLVYIYILYPVNLS